ncbi:MAG TPA: cytochrome c3 family protein [Nannocystis sp.]
MAFGTGLYVQAEGGLTRGEVPATAPVTHGPMRGGSPVYPEQDIPLRFSHAQHLGLGLQCGRCHGKIADSDKAADFNFPTGKVCDSCHGPQHPRPPTEEARCGQCHTRVAGARVTATLRAPKAQLHFSHKAHMARGTGCATCHGDMSKVRMATVLNLPSEATCLTCHDGLKASNRCATCHPADTSGRLATRSFSDRVMPALVPRGTSAWGAAHDLAFVEDHRGPAKANPGLCAQCHSETFCTDCHAGAVRPMRIHAADYITAHALDARARTQDCQACHRVQTDCLACHQRLGFGGGPDAKFGVGSPLRFHPVGWDGPPDSPQSHAFAAQRNIAACASCHTEDSCLACHATTGARIPGLNVSPHGPGFAGSMRCQALAGANRRVCLKCHEPGDPRNECL